MPRSLSCTLLFLTAWLMAGCTPSELTTVTRSMPKLGTTAEITIRFFRCPRQQDYIEQAFKEIDRTAAELDADDPNSVLAGINRAGGGTVGAGVAEVIAEGLRLHGVTGGLFDPTIRPVLEYYQDINQELKSINPADLAMVRRLVDAGGVRQAGERISFTSTQTVTVGRRAYAVKLDLGGILHGVAADRGLAALKLPGIIKAQVTVGGSTALYTTDPLSTWTFGARDPLDTRHIRDVLEIGNHAVTTLAAWEPGTATTGHEQLTKIIDPRTGTWCKSDVLSVTVLAERGLIANALATTLLMMNGAEGLAFINNLTGDPERNLAWAIITTRDGRRLESKGVGAFLFRPQTTTTGEK